MGCVVCKPLSGISAEDLCLSIFFPSGATDHTTQARKEKKKKKRGNDDPLKAPARQQVITSPERDQSGWPKWLSTAAGDALDGWAPRGADSFEMLEKIGSGTYSNVYKATDLRSGSIVALKKVRIDGITSVRSSTDAGATESAKFMAREIALLRSLGSHSNIVKLEGLVTSRVATSASLYLVFEYMEHDLAGLAAQPGLKFSLPQIKCYMKQLLSALSHCHKSNILHRDIKTSNLLVSQSNVLKLADFGLATSFDPTNPNPKPMTSQVVTLWYRPPELLLGTGFYGTGVDLWSVGCILGELLIGKPILPGRTEVEQLHMIFKLCGTPTEEYFSKLKLPSTAPQSGFKVYQRCLKETFGEVPKEALDLLEMLLSVDPKERGTADDALKSEFFNTEPFACEPSSLPQYPPSKEMDIRLRNQEKRRKAKGNVSVGYESKSKARFRNSGQLKAMLTPDISSKSNSISDVPRLITSQSVRAKPEKFPPPHLDGSIGYNLESSISDFSSNFDEMRREKSHNGIFGLMDQYRSNSSRRKAGTGTGICTGTKVRSNVKMMSNNAVLIGGFRPYRTGKNKVHGKV